MSLRESLRLLSPAAYALVAMRGVLFLGVQISYFVGVMGTLTYSMGANALVMACVVGILNSMLVIGSFAGGAYLDSHDPRSHACMTIICLTTAAICFVLFGTTDFNILICSAMFGMSVGFADSISRAYPAYLTKDPTTLKAINSVLSLTSNIAGILGPILGGFIAAFVPSRMVFIVTIVTSLTTSLFVRAFLAGVTQTVDCVHEQDAKSRIAGGFSYVFHNATLGFLFCMSFVSFLGFGAFDPLESLYYRDVLHVGVTWMGWLSSAFGIGCAIGNVLVLKIPHKFVNSRTLLYSIFAMGLACMLYVSTSNVFICFTGQVLEGIAEGITFPLITTLTQTHTQVKQLGVVNSVMNFGFNMAGTVPLFFAPAIAVILGVQGTLIAASLFVASIPLSYLLFFHHKVDKLVEEERRLDITIQAE